MNAGEIARLTAFGLGGFALGWASFASLRLNTWLYVEGGVLRPIALHVARLTVIVAAAVWAALQGAGPLVAGAAGLTLARPIAVKLLGRVR